MSGYMLVKINMDNEDDYNSPLDTNERGNLHEVDYEAPLNGPADHRSGQSILTLDSGLKCNGYSPQNITGLERYSPGAFSPQQSLQSENNHIYGIENNENHYCNKFKKEGSQYSLGKFGTQLGTTLLNRSRVGGERGSLAKSPHSESNKNISRKILLTYSSSRSQLTGIFTPSSIPNCKQDIETSMKRSSFSSELENSQSKIFHYKYDISTRCSWKFMGFFLTCFSYILLTALVYTAVSNDIIGDGAEYETAKMCAMSEDSVISENVFNTQEDFITKKTTVAVRTIYNTTKSGSSKDSFHPKNSVFRPLALSIKQVNTILPYSYWNFQIHQKISAYILITFSIPRGSSFGLYARKNAIPSLTNNDLRDVLKGFGSLQKEYFYQQEIRSLLPALIREGRYYLDKGHWFLSLYNDAGKPQNIEMKASVSHDFISFCSRGCSGNGECILGYCECSLSFHGPACSQNTCPILCSNNGEYREGKCSCNPGWKGNDCSIHNSACLNHDCNIDGNCINGECVCTSGLNGEFCDKVDCEDPSCSGHGLCIDGACICQKGWGGKHCTIIDEEERQCLPVCSGNGLFSINTQKCECYEGFTGTNCDIEICDVDCGRNGNCEFGTCICNDNWHGEKCSIKKCDKRCSVHGVCSNGTCLCTNGWNGRHCTLDGCPGSCHDHGTCTTTYNNAWECICDTGWYGAGCDIKLELNCNDKIDNDEDGLVDCEDPECCENPFCERSQLCHTVAAPIDILLRKQPPAITASFFERMRFIIEDKGLQSYAKKKEFNESLFWSQFNPRRAAVVRGQVVTPIGMGLIGVRVSTIGVNEGFTMTRDDGWFDLVVNGGGPVMLQFGRNPYSTLRLALYVPWNEVMVLSPIKLSGDEMPIQVPEHYQNIELCATHNYNLMQPIALADWINKYQGTKVFSSAILAEAQIVKQSIEILGSDIRLMYHSSRSKGYYSTIQLQLTPETISEELIHIHLIINIEGVLEKKMFEADPNIFYTYAWDRLNIYRQRVYGITTATVKVGYEYIRCGMVWHVQSIQVPGHDMVLSDLAGWNLDVTHKYNFHEGILQKGDGTNIYLKYKPLVVTTLMGNGIQRKVDCPSTECNGLAASSNLLAPKSLTLAPDGSLFVADHNLIRRINPDGTTITLLHLNSTRISYRYHLAHQTYTGELEQQETVFVSLPEAHRVIKISSLLNPESIESNWEYAVGNGEQCVPGDQDSCGDGGKAVDARLTYPKGLAIGAEGKLYIADGNNIRIMDEFGIINTLLGHNHHWATWKPLPCTDDINREEIQLNWPTDLAISPLDGTLHFIDDNMLLQVTKDNRVRIVAGRPVHCNPSNYGLDSPNSAVLNNPQSIAFSQNGDIYIAESDSQRINRVRQITTDWKIETIAGKNSNCNCLHTSCKCFDSDSYLATKTRFSAISSLAMTPDGKLFVADQGNYRIRIVSSMMPTNENDEVFEVPDTDSHELYIFNCYGQHILTKDIMTQQTLFKMEYSQSTSNGKLLSIVDSSKRKLFIMRDYSGQVTIIQTSNRQKHSVKVNRMGYLESFERPDKYRIEFKYISRGLLKSKLDSQNLGYVYKYDQYGRLIQSVGPTGEITSFLFNLTSLGGNIMIDKSMLSVTSNKVIDMSIEGTIKMKTMIRPDNSLIIKSGIYKKETLSTIPHPIISHINPIIGDSYPMIGELRVELGLNLVSKIEWEYNVQTNSNDKQMFCINKKLRVNGENILIVSYDKLQRREVLLNADKIELLEIKYDKESRPVNWVVPGQEISSWAPVSHTYNRFGQLIEWKWGEIQELYKYDKNGRLSNIKKGINTILSYDYQDSKGGPFRVISGSQGTYLIYHDSISGSVKSITTPGGHIHSWNIQPDIGSIIWSFCAPWNFKPYRVIFNAQGNILSTHLPSGNEQVFYVYRPSGELLKIYTGITEINFGLDSVLDNIESVFVSHGEFLMQEKRNYHNGFIKEQHVSFSGILGFNNVNIKYQFDGTGRPFRVNGKFGKKEAPIIIWKYNPNLGILESVDGLQIKKIHYNKTKINDLNGNFLKTFDLDKYNNLKSIIYSIKQKQILSLNLGYNNDNKLESITFTDHEGKSSEEIYLYSFDGHLSKTWGPQNYSYSYNKNGNIIKIDEGSQNNTIAYGPGDRVIRFGCKKIIYDENGFVIAVDNMFFLHNALGHLIEHVTDNGIKVKYYYDSLGRLIVWTDSNGLISQYYYTNPVETQQVTYVHNPQNYITQKLTYDSNNHIIMIETEEQTLYVATDHLGSPLLIFKSNGNIMKRIRYTPFGYVYDDSQPNLQIPIGYRGGISNIHGTFIHLDGRIYEPNIAQWLSPDWLSVQKGLKTPLDLFIYRFFNNNPINLACNNVYMITLTEWAKIYGFDTSKIFPSKSIKKLGSVSEHHIQGNILLSNVNVISELDMSVQRAKERLYDLRFVHHSYNNINQRYINLIPRFSSIASNFGKGFLLSVTNDKKAVILPVEVQNSVVQKIFQSVLNTSIFLEVSYSEPAKSVYYFVKKNKKSFFVDSETVHRLAGAFTIFPKDIEKGKELSIVNKHFEVKILYGLHPDMYQNGMLNIFTTHALNTAWIREKTMVSHDFTGS